MNGQDKGHAVDVRSSVGGFKSHLHLNLILVLFQTNTFNFYLGLKCPDASPLRKEGRQAGLNLPEVI